MSFLLGQEQADAGLTGFGSEFEFGTDAADQIETAYYLRAQVRDEPGVLADITRILADEGVSIDAVIQRQPAEGEPTTDIILMTHRTVEQRIDAAIGRIEALPSVPSSVVRLRVEQLN